MTRVSKEFFKHSLFFIFLTLLGAYVIGVVEDGKRDQYLKMQTKILQTKYATNYKYFKIMSQDIYSMFSENFGVTDLIAQVKDANATQKDLLRERLYTLLKKRYKHLKNMGVNELNFYLLDNSTFLQMNNKKAHGEHAGVAHKGIVLTNKSKNPTEGFEIKDNIQGFRFIYPLFDDTRNYLGCMEISYSSKEILASILDNFVYEVHFLVLRDVLDFNNHIKEVTKYYDTSDESTDYLIERATHYKRDLKKLDNVLASSPLLKEMQKNMKASQAFSLSTFFNFHSIIVTLLPIKDMQKSNAAYIVVYSESDYLSNLAMEKKYIFMLFYSSMLLLFIFGIYTIMHKHRLHVMAHFDALTQLPNRSSFYIEFRLELDKAKRFNNKVALLFIDLDGFKEVNDTYGHDIGDSLLVDVAQRLRESIRTTDLAARLGGDEFTVILSGVNDMAESMQIAQKIIDTLNRPFHINHHTITIGASIGVALYPEHADDIDDLVKNADDMMYVVKASGKNSAKLFTQ
jgi:diguanylate cyclase (GGDEF)-like protein